MNNKISGVANYPRLASLLYNTPLMIHPDKAEVIEQVFRSYVNGEGIRAEFTRDTEQPSDIGALAVREGVTADKPYVLTEGGTAVIPVIGALLHRLDIFDAMSGMTSYGRLAKMIRLATENSAVKGILLEVDSPGGSVNGLFELADQIIATRAVKPIWSVANEGMYSAAYAIGSATHRITAPKTASVGSIGVIAMHVDQSGFDEKRGVLYTPIYAGKHKNDLSSHQPLNNEARVRMQSMVDDLYGIFTSHVARARAIDEGRVRGTEAQVYMIEEAIQIGLADAVATLDETVEQLEGSYSGKKTFSFNTAGTTGKSNIGGNSMEMTAENVAKEFPGLALELRQQGRTAMTQELSAQPGALAALNLPADLLAREYPAHAETLRVAGATTERARIQAVQAQAMPGHHALITTLMFDGKTTGPEAAVQVLNAERSKMTTHGNGLDTDAAAVNKIAQVDPGTSTAPVATAPYNQATAEAEWNASTKLQAEFPSKEIYCSYLKNQHNAKIRSTRGQ